MQQPEIYNYLGISKSKFKKSRRQTEIIIIINNVNN